MAYRYKVGNQTVTLDVDPGSVAVRFEDTLPRTGRASVAEASGTGPFSRRYEVPNEKLTIVPVVAGIDNGAGDFGVLTSLNAKPEVSKAQPVFRVNGNQVVASDRLIVGFDDPAKAAEIAERHSLRPVKTRDDVVIFEVPPETDIFETVAALDAEPGVRFAEPDLITIGRHIPKRVAPGPEPLLSDPLVARQYAMQITRASDAWPIQQGAADIKVAILDEGVDTAHPDLAAAIAAGGTYDAADGDSYQEPNPWDGHGTACAGLAAAIPANDVGIRGVGGGCSIMTARIAQSNFDGGPWVTTNEGIASAIHWCWTSGADVLSNSWGGGAPSNDITEQFEKARRLGRGGRGCIVVIAAGNEHSRVSFPGTLPNVLTVSASNQYDEAKTPTSNDGETWWGTNHGPEIDVAAPGVQNLTTDISGGGGYDPSDYAQRFNGTSSATPIVAGACALILSANPTLTEAEVRDIIGVTADKAGAIPYVAGRNDYFGRGRLNVLAAVTEAQSR
jgi:subtilisin family serine protease